MATLKVKDVKELVWGHVCNLKKAGGQLQVRKAPKKDSWYVVDSVDGVREVMDNISNGGLVLDGFKWVFIVKANAEKKRLEPSGIALVTCRKRNITDKLWVTVSAAHTAEDGTGTAKATGVEDQKGGEEEEGQDEDNLE